LGFLRTGGWRKLHNEKLYNLNSSKNNIRAVKSRRTRLVELAARMGNMRNTCKILVGKPEGKNHLVDLGVDGRIILQ
jgi:hypothetical protein